MEDSDAEKVAQNYMSLYNYNVTQAKQAFKNLSLEIDATVDNKIDVLAKMIKIKLNNGSQRPLKILLTGKKSTNSIEFRDKMAGTFGLNVIDIDSLLLTHIKNKTYFGNLIVEYKQNDKELPSNLLIDIIMERVEKVDCQIKGFVLDICDRKIQLAKHFDPMQLFFHLAIVADSPNGIEDAMDLKEQMNLKFQKSIAIETQRNINDHINRVFFEITHFYDDDQERLSN
jgi:hypothetical protein